MPGTMLDGFRPFTSREARDRFLAHLDILDRRWPIEHDDRMVRTPYGETFVRTGGPGDGPPLVLLPGGQSSSLVWCRLIEPLSARFRTYALDAIYDEGRSVPTRPVRDIDDLRSWLDAVLDGLGLTRDVAMAGQSYGCYASAEYALHAPQRLRKLAWIAPVMLGSPVSREFMERLIRVADGRRESLEEFCHWTMPSISAHHPGEFDRRVDEILLARECYGSIFPPARAPVMSDEDLRRIATPTIHILGDRDVATSDPRGAGGRVRSLMPRVETMLVAGAGHDIVASDTEVVAERLLRFL
jgi:pimeloyl-ACP methyl ester carboxylesterase